MADWLEDLDKIVAGETPQEPVQDRDKKIIQGLMSPEATDWDSFASTFDDTVRSARQEAGIEPGYIRTVGKGLVRGGETLLSGTGAITRWVGDVAGIAPVSDAGKYWQDYWDTAAQRGWAAPDPFVFRGDFLANPSLKRAIGIVGEAIPSLAAAVTTAFLTGGGTLGAIAGASLLGALEGAPQYVEAREKGKSIPEASAYGALSTAATTLLEFLPISRYMKGMAPKGAKAWVGRLMEMGLEEAGQEGSQQLVQNMIAKYGYDDTQRLFEGIVESMIGGFGAGVVASGTTAKLNSFIEKHRNVDGVDNDVSDAWTQLTENIMERGTDIEVDREAGAIIEEASRPELSPEAPIEQPIVEEKGEYGGIGHIIEPTGRVAPISTTARGEGAEGLKQLLREVGVPPPEGVVPLANWEEIEGEREQPVIPGAEEPVIPEGEQPGGPVGGARAPGINERIKQAAELGAKAFAEGREATPAKDTELMKLIAGLPVGGGGAKIIDAWSKAWHKANVEAPVPEAEEHAKVGDTITDNLITGKIVGEGTIGKDIPAWKIETEPGKFDYIVKGQERVIEEAKTEEPEELDLATAEPWKMTSEQWLSRMQEADSWRKDSAAGTTKVIEEKQRLKFGVELSKEELAEGYRVTHEDVISKAIDEGLPVPEHVIAEYPKIAERIKAEAEKEVKAPEAEMSFEEFEKAEMTAEDIDKLIESAAAPRAEEVVTGARAPKAEAPKIGAEAKEVETPVTKAMKEHVGESFQDIPFVEKATEAEILPMATNLYTTKSGGVSTGSFILFPDKLTSPVASKLNKRIEWLKGYTKKGNEMVARANVREGMPDDTDLIKGVEANSPGQYIGSYANATGPGETQINAVFRNTKTRDVMEFDETKIAWFKKNIPDFSLTLPGDKSHPAGIMSGNNLVGIIMPMRGATESEKLGQALRGLPVETTLEIPGAKPEIKKVSQEDFIKKFVQEAGEGIAETAKGIYELFGGASLKSFPGAIDEDTYAKAKVHFDAAYTKFKAAGKTLNDMVRYLLEQAGEHIKPYLARWLRERKGVAEPEAPKALARDLKIGDQVRWVEAGVTYEGAVESIDDKYAVIKRSDTAREYKALDGAQEFEVLNRKIGGPEEIEGEREEAVGGPRKPKKKRKRKIGDIGEKLGGKRASTDHTTRTAAIEVELDGKITTGTPKEIVKALLKMTEKATLFPTSTNVKEETYGARRYRAEIRNQLTSFLVYAGESWGGTLNRTGYTLTYGEALEKAASNDVQQKVLKKFAAEYISVLEQIAHATKDAATIKSNNAALLKLIYPNGIEVNEKGEGPGLYTWHHKDHGIGPAGLLFAKYSKSKYEMYRLLFSQVEAFETTENEPDKDQDIRRRRVSIFDIETPVEFQKTRGMEDIPSDENIIEKMFKDAFGIRGIDFGNWVTGPERIRNLNLTWDSFQQLAKTLGFPTKGISINAQTRLGIGFGARGRGGRAAAAFYPADFLIGLTRPNGDGSLCHEWGHAFDDGTDMSMKNNVNPEYQKEDALKDLKTALRYFFNIEKLQQDVDRILRGMWLNSELRTNRKEDAKKYLMDKWAREINQRTEYFNNARELDRGRPKIYWSKTEEMFARAFEAYVADKLQGSNYYLVDTDFVAPGGVEHMFNRQYGAYPTAKERQRFNDIFDHFFQGLNWSEDGIPSVKDDYVPVTKHERDIAQKAVDDLLKRLDEIYEALYQGTQSDDGLFWYAYKHTQRGPMMQPDGYMAYDTKFAISDEDVAHLNKTAADYQGSGALGYEDALSANDIIQYGLLAVTHNINDSKTYLKEPEVLTPPGEGEVTGGTGEKPPTGEGPTTGPKPESDEENATGEKGESTPSIAYNYTIKPTDKLEGRTAAERFTDNISAIRLLLKIESENRMATPAEQEILVRYSSWGGLGSVLDRWGSGSTWRARYEIIQNLGLPEDTLKGMRATLPNAFFTPPRVIKGIYEGVMRLGFRGGRILEPSMGTGNFIGLMPEEMRRVSNIQGVEIDNLTSRIAKQLYQSSHVTNKSFHEIPMPDNFFDLIISNVPFGIHKLHDKRHNPNDYNIHDYFINKSLDLLKPGGLGVFITSTGTMDKVERKVIRQPGQKEDYYKEISPRTEFMKKADVIAAIRLPHEMYEGAQASSDIIFFRKKGDNLVELKGADISRTKDETLQYFNRDGTPAGWTVKVPINRYWSENPDNILGKVGARMGRYNDPVAWVMGDRETFDKQIYEIVQKFPVGVVQEIDNWDDVDLADRIPLPEDRLDGAFFVDKDGKLYINNAGIPELYDEKSGAKRDNGKRIRKLISMRDTIRQLLKAQATDAPQDKIDALRKKLNDQYDAFVKRFGYINDKLNIAAFEPDPDSARLLELEIWDYAAERPKGKADIFFKNVIQKQVRPTRANDPFEALIYSLTWRGKVDLPWMQKLTGASHIQLIEALQGQIFDDPTQGWVTATEYLSGHLGEKLKIAERLATTDSAYEVNVRALKEAMPPRLEPHQIKIKLGAAYIPVKYINNWISDRFGHAGRHVIIDHIPSIGKWGIDFWNRSSGTIAAANAAKTMLIDHPDATHALGTPRQNFFPQRDSTDKRFFDLDNGNRGSDYSYEGLLGYALNGGFPRVMDRVPGNDKGGYERDENGNIIKVYNPGATESAIAKIHMLHRDFETWVWDDEARTKELTDIYNFKYNSFAEKKADGSHLKFPGKVPDDVIELMQHQKNAAWRWLLSKTTYLAHEVGTGKTFSMATSAMEAKRMGIAKKPMIAVKNATKEQIRGEIMRLYPTARILFTTIPGEVAPKIDEETGEEIEQEQRPVKAGERRRVFNRIAMNDWDVVVVTHEGLTNIPLSPETQIEFIQQELDAYEAAYIALNQQDVHTKKAETLLQQAILRLRAQLEKLSDIPREPGVPFFEEMGIDMLIVDEVHSHKNIRFPTKFSNVKGVGNSHSQRGQDLIMKSRYMLNHHQGKMLYASGTPLTNSVGELFNISRMMQPSTLNHQDLGSFDAWANTFGYLNQEYEISPTGGGFRTRQRFSEFINVPDLMGMVRQFMDIVRAKDVGIKRPKVYGGGPQVVEVEPNEYIKWAKGLIKARERNIRQWGIQATYHSPMQKFLGLPPTHDNIVRLITDGRLIAMDARLFDPNQRDFELTKTNAAVDKMFERYKKPVKATYPKGHKLAGQEYDENRHVQLIFADRGVPNSKEDRFNLYEDVKQKLIKKGVPQDEIAFIHDFKGDDRPKLFRLVQDGKIRFLLGSTGKMGIGVNVQDRVSGIVMLDTDWNYANVEQRIGRGWRLGNRINEIIIEFYGTKETVDAFMWETVGFKERIFGQVMAVDSNARNIEDISATASLAGNMAAMLSNNPLHREKVELDGAINRLSAMREEHNQKVIKAKGELATGPEIRDSHQAAILKYESRIPILEEFDSLRIGDKIYDFRKKGGEANTAAEAFVGAEGDDWYHTTEAFGQHKGQRRKMNIDVTGNIIGELGKSVYGEETYFEPEEYVEKVPVLDKDGKPVLDKKGKPQMEKVKKTRQVEKKRKTHTFERVKISQQQISDLMKKIEDAGLDSQKLMANIIGEGFMPGEVKSYLKMGYNAMAETIEYRYIIGSLAGTWNKMSNGVARGMTNMISYMQQQIAKSDEAIKAWEDREPKLREIAAAKWQQAEELANKIARREIVTEELVKIQAKEDSEALEEEYEGLGHAEIRDIVIEDDSVDDEVVLDDPKTELSIGKTTITHADIVARKLTAPGVKGLQRLVRLAEKAFKKAGLPQEVIDRVRLDFAPILDLRGKNIQESIDAWAKEGQTVGTILGATTIKRYHALMTLSLEQDLTTMERTAFHEAFHIIAKWILPAREYERLMRHYKSSEGAAEAYADYIARHEGMPRPVGALRRIFLKIKRMLQLVGNALRGRGFSRPEDFWAKILTKQYIPHYGRGQLDVTTTAFKIKRSSVLERIFPENVLPRIGVAGLTRAKLTERILSFGKEALQTFRPGQMFPKLPNKYFGRANEILRHFVEIPQFSRSQAVQELRDILEPDNMTPEQYDIFNSKILLDDMLKDMDSEEGPLSNWQELVDEHGEIAFGFTSREEVAEALRKADALVARDTSIQEALERREKYMKDLRKRLVKAKMLPESVLDDERYFHHQVLEYANAKFGTGTSSKDVRVKKAGWMLHRIGSIKDYNAHYLESEFEVISQGISRLEAKKDIDDIGKEYDVMPHLRAEARAANLRAAEAKWHEMYGDSIVLDPTSHPLWGSRAGIAMASSNLEKMAEAGKLEEPGPEGQPPVPVRFRDAINKLALLAEIRRSEEDAPFDLLDDDEEVQKADDFFPMLAYMVEHGTVGSSWAATILKNIQGRNKIIKEAAGSKFKTWRDMMREREPEAGSQGWAVWKPKPNTAWYMTNSINDKLLEKVLTGAIELQADDVKKVLARGVDVMWVIPQELAEVMDGNQFMFLKPDNVVEAFMEKSLNLWKRWILINPARIVKYNLNNLSGDLDIVLAYDPKILKYAKQAAKDLWAYHYNKPMHEATKEEFKQALRDGVIGSGMTVHDIPDISEAPGLRRLMEAMSADTRSRNAIRYIERFWEGSKNFTTWRENVLRLAAYRYFLQQVRGGARVFGASDVNKVNAIPEDQWSRKAALLARELIGDYGSLSKGGQWLRRHLIPFYSWMEINAPRYYRMMKNLQYEGQPRGVKLRVGGVMAKRAAFLGAKMAMLYAAVQLFNNLFWPDEEEELGETGRRQLHIILGRRGDGSVMTLRFQGALSDALAFFGLEDAPDDMKDIVSGKKSIYKWLAEMPYEFTNKFVQGVRPEIKAPGELITGKTLYPEFIEPRPIRDKLEYVARLFSAETLYRRIANKPIRGDSVAGRVLNDLASLVTYTADPGEVAYYETRRMVQDFLVKNNLEKPMEEPTNRMNALYYYKQAIKYGDAKAAEKYLAKYKALGGKLENLRVSIKNTHPLSALPKRTRWKFIKSLSAKDRETLARGKEWYRKTYLQRR